MIARTQFSSNYLGMTRAVLLNFSISIGNSVISSDISKLLYVISRAIRRVKFETVLKYHEWYLCQISHTNHAIICLYYYPQKVCNFHMQVFQIKLKYHCSKPIRLQKFLMLWYDSDNSDVESAGFTRLWLVNSLLH